MAEFVFFPVYTAYIFQKSTVRL